jgi:S-adenosyl methyltransferase
VTQTPGDGVIDTSTPHSARRYNYWLGGKDKLAVDRESGDLIAKNFPTVRLMAVENRRFLRRATTFLTALWRGPAFGEFTGEPWARETFKTLIPAPAWFFLSRLGPRAFARYSRKLSVR